MAVTIFSLKSDFGKCKKGNGKENSKFKSRRNLSPYHVIILQASTTLIKSSYSKSTVLSRPMRQWFTPIGIPLHDTQYGHILHAIAVLNMMVKEDGICSDQLREWAIQT